MSLPDQPPDAGASFLAILDRMRLLGDDFTAHSDDCEVIRVLAGAPEAAPGPAGDVLPDEYCTQLNLPPGTPYRVAARRLMEFLALGPPPPVT